MLAAMLIQTWLEEAGCRTVIADRVEQALKAIEDQPIDLAVLDLELPGGDSYGVADS